MQILPLSDNQQQFSGRIDRKTQRFISKELSNARKIYKKSKNNSEKAKVYFQYNQRLLKDLQEFMKNFHEDTVLTMKGKGIFKHFVLKNTAAKSKLNFKRQPYLKMPIYQGNINVASPQLVYHDGMTERNVTGMRNFVDNFKAQSPEKIDAALFDDSNRSFGGYLHKLRSKIEESENPSFIGKLIKNYRIKKYNKLVTQLGHSENAIAK